MTRTRRGKHGLKPASTPGFTFVMALAPDGGVLIASRSGFRNDALGSAKYYRGRGHRVWLEAENQSARRPGYRRSPLVLRGDTYEAKQ